METERLIELVVMARQGDADAMQTLYLDAYRSVYYLALRMVKNPEDAEDITQDVFITVQEKISALREPGAFYKWVNQITVNKCNYLLRKYKGIARLDDGEEVLALVDDNPLNLPDKAIDDAATRQIILDVIDALPDGQRVCVMLYYYQQNTISQIADMLETNENTVKTRLSLARAKIRAALEEKEKKEGIKLYGIPLALTPILRQAMEQFTVPEGVAERMWENISKAKVGGAPPNGGPGADQPGGSGTSGQNVPKSGGIETPGGAGTGATSAVGTAATGAGMTLVTKIIIGIIAAAVVTSAVIFVPPLLSSEPANAPVSPSVSEPGAITESTTEPTFESIVEPITEPTSSPTSAPTETPEANTSEPESTLIPPGKYVNSAPNIDLNPGYKHWFHIYADGTFVQHGIEFEGIWYRSGTYTVSGDMIYFSSVSVSPNEDMSDAVEIVSYDEDWSETNPYYNYTFRFDGTNLISVDFIHNDVAIGDIFILE